VLGGPGVLLRAEARGRNPVLLGQTVAERLLEQGGASLLAPAA
jgi:hypothetical protein